jgi:DNA-binding PadR family transcriptional regulator
VQVSESEGKKVYAITEAGRAFLSENQPSEGEQHSWHGRHAPDEQWEASMALMHELRELGPLFGQVLRSAKRDPQKQEQLRKILAGVREQLRVMLGDETL